MPVLKNKFKGFTIISNKAAHSPALSTSALSYLIRIKSKPEGWKFSINRLAAEYGDGKYKVGSALKELETLGYLVRKQIVDADGKFIDMNYIINDKIDKSEGFTIISNQALHDSNMSTSALCYLVRIKSKPKGWKSSINRLAAEYGDGKYKVGAALKELEALGYLVRKQIVDEKGRFVDMDYIINDELRSDSIGVSQEKVSQVSSVDNSINENKKQSQNNVNAVTKKQLKHTSSSKPFSKKPYTKNQYTDNPYSKNSAAENQDSLIINSVEKNYYSSYQSDLNTTEYKENENKSSNKEMIDKYIALIKNNISCQDNESSYTEIAKIIAETLCTDKPTIRIGKRELPAHIVKKKLLSIRRNDVQYLLDSISLCSSTIHNPNAYILTSLYNNNAPSSRLIDICSKAQKSSPKSLITSNPSYDIEEWERFARSFDLSRVKKAIQK